MKLFLALAITFIVALGLVFMPPAILTSHAVDQAGGQPTRTEIIPGEYIVTLKPEFIGEPAVR